LSRRRKSSTSWGNRIFAILGLVIIITMVVALVISALQPGI